MSLTVKATFTQTCKVNSESYNIYVGLYVWRVFCNRVRTGHSRSSKVDDFGTNRTHICNFLLVCRCYYGPILHSLWVTATCWLKSTYFFRPLSHSALALHMFPLEFCGDVNHKETRVMGLYFSEDRMIVTCVILTWYRSATDRQTGRRNQS